jgi:hypothetical protein
MKWFSLKNTALKHGWLCASPEERTSINTLSKRSQGGDKVGVRSLLTSLM